MSAGSGTAWPFPVGKSPFRMKGITYRTFMRYVDDELPGGRAEFLAALESPELRAFADQPFLAASWYDVAASPPMNEAAGRILGMDMAAFAASRGRAQAEADLSGGVYSWLLKVANPKAVANGLVRVTRQYFDFGGVELTDSGRGYAKVLRTGVPAYLVRWYVAASTPFVEYALERTNASNPRVKTSISADERSHGVPCNKVSFDVLWNA